MRKASPITETDIHGYVDGRLDDARRRAVADWLKAHQEDAARVADYRLLGERWREIYADVLREPVPRVLLEVLAPRSAWAGRLAWAAAASILVTLAAIGAWMLLEPDRPNTLAADMIARSALAHAVYAAERQHPVETGAGTNEELLGWLSQRLRMRVKAPNLEPMGLRLIGGRLLPGEKAPAAMLMYEGAEGQRVSLYWGPEFRQEHETVLRYAQVARGERVYYWLDEECGYAITSSDLPQPQLLRVALLAHGELEK